MDGGTTDQDGGPPVDGGPKPQRNFRVVIENISDESALPTPFAPGVWAVHGDHTPMFAVDEADRGEGLEALAEDGDPSAMATSLMGQAEVKGSAVFDTPMGAMSPAPIMPGESYELIFSTNADAPRLSFATMLVQSNDLILATPAIGFALFDGAERPIVSRDITADLDLWDVGTEVNEAPGSGPSQAPRQMVADTGSAEGVVHPFSGSTRALPLARDIVEIGVRKTADMTIELTVSNVSAAKGSFETSVSPVFWATHAASWTMFTVGDPAGSALERLAENSTPTDLATTHTGALGVGTAMAETGKAGPGESYAFSVTVGMNQPRLSMAIGLSETNDAFLSFAPAGIALLDEMGRLRPEAELAVEINRKLIVWDAGTEANEVPGVGRNQSARQMGSTGAADPIPGVRPYRDATNDLAGARAGGIANVSITGAANGTFNVALENTSGGTAFPTQLSPLVWVLHDGSVKVFTNNGVASAELEALAEDGDPSGLKGTLNALGGTTANIVRTPEGMAVIGPLLPGERYAFTVTPTAQQPSLNLLSMVVDSNDTFLALGPTGVRLLDAAGNPRTDTEIARDVAMQLAAWDAGTEGNQAGGAGPDQAPRQAIEGRGPVEGRGVVEKFSGRVWSYPAVDELVRVRVETMNQ